MSSVAPPAFGRDDVEILETSLCHAGHLRVERLRLRCRRYQGDWSAPFQREVLKREPGVGVLLYDPASDQLLMVEQFRVGCLDDARNGPWALELVAGLVEAGETPEAVAIRESEEEAGIHVGSVLPIVSYYNSPGGSAEKLSIFCAGFDATAVRTGIFGLDTESENIRSCLVLRADAMAAVAAGRINNAMSIIALQWLQLNLAEVRATLRNT
ncbi:MAG: NUDIX domain-containing protein [Pseudohongiellaceae bacterium]|jgi:ADP-ribose pyrophosphatase